ncbi:hypothetical protein, partial [Rhizobium sp. UBA1881]
MDDSNDLFSGMPLTKKQEDAPKPAAAAPAPVAAPAAPSAAANAAPRQAPPANSTSEDYGASSIRVLEG